METVAETNSPPPSFSSFTPPPLFLHSYITPSPLFFLHSSSSSSLSFSLPPCSSIIYQERHEMKETATGVKRLIKGSLRMGDGQSQSVTRRRQHDGLIDVHEVLHHIKLGGAHIGLSLNITHEQELCCLLINLGRWCHQKSSDWLSSRCTQVSSVCGTLEGNIV